MIDLKEDCQTCNGAGNVLLGADRDGGSYGDCPECGGRGWNPTDQAIELQAEAFYDDDDSYPEKWEHQIEDVKDWYRQKSRVGLVAVLSMGDTK